MQFHGRTDEFLILKEISKENCSLLKEQIESSLSIIWNQGADTVLQIDSKPYTIKSNELIFLTEFHHVEIKKIDQVRLIRFNRSFYCIKTNDSEVGCKGILFFGASNVPLIKIPEDEQEVFNTVWKMFLLEMESHDKLQIEMLQMMLKRFIILCTRLYKEQNLSEIREEPQHDLIREFNFMVEQHFREKHTVSEYADLLNKSPKTLSNLFAKINQKRPLQIIQDRIQVEARRLLVYSEQSVKEIAYELGFESIQTFSRFFKKQEGVSPVEYRKNTLHAA